MARYLSPGLYIAIAMISLSTIAIAITIAIPSIDDFDPRNPLWNGYSALASRLGARYIDPGSLGSLDPLSTALLIVAPTKNLELIDVGVLRGYISKGGVVIFADEHTSINTLLKTLGVDVEILAGIVIDPLFKYRSRELVIATLDFGEIRGDLYLNYASALSLDPQDPKCIARTSPFSFLDVDRDLSKSSLEPYGPFCVGAIYRIGDGYLVVFTDSSLWINSMIDLGSNYHVLENIVGKRILYILAGLRDQSLYTLARSRIAEAVDLIVGSDAKYLAIFLVAFIAYRFTLYIGRARSMESFRDACREIDLVLRTHPGWDRDAVIKVAGDLYGSEIHCE